MPGISSSVHLRDQDQASRLSELDRAMGQRSVDELAGCRFARQGGLDMKRSLDPRHVPTGVEAVFPLVEEWGLEDDRARSVKVGEADLRDLRRLVEAVDAVDDDVLYGWLSGAESHSETVSAEYAAITALTMAADQARVRLRREGSR